MGAEVLDISRFSYRRHSHANPENSHSVTYMKVWREEHPMNDIQKITQQILEMPQRNMALSQKITDVTMKYWMDVMFGVFGQNNSVKEDEKIN